MRASLLALLLAGCGGPDATATLHLPFEPIEPGTERQSTLTANLPNEAPLWIRGVAWTSPAGLHHSRLDAPPGDGSDGIYPILALPVLASSGTLTLPPGHAFRFHARQAVEASYHYVNAGPIPIEGAIDLRFDVAGAPDPPIPVSMLVLAALAIDIPPHASLDVEATCALPRDLQLHSLLPHTHALGLGVEVFRAGGPGDGERLYRSTGWDAAPIAAFDPPISLRAGEALRFVCHYHNPGDAPVTGGAGAADEMCVVAGHVSPASEPFVRGVKSVGGACDAILK